MVYDAICSECGQVEIEKPMRDEFPRRHDCGGKLSRLYTATPVHYNAPGFYSFDVSRFEKQVGPERAAKVKDKNDDYMKRMRAGRLTPSEKRLEALSSGRRV